MLGLHVFRQTGPPRRIDCLASPSVCHMKMEASRKVTCPWTQQANLAVGSPYYPYVMSAKLGSWEYHFLKSFGMTRLGKWTPDLPSVKQTLKTLRHRGGYSASSLLVSAPPTSLPLLFSPPIWLCPLLRLSFYLKFSGRNCLLSSPVLSGCRWSPDTRFSRGTTRLMSWPDGERYLRSLQSLVVSLLLSLVSTLVFLRTGGMLSHLNSLTRRFPRFLPRNLCSLVTLAVPSLVFAATHTVSISPYFSRIGRI